MIDTLGAGGAERQLLYIINGLDRQRYQPLVLTVYDERETPSHYRAELEAQDIPIYSLNLSPQAGGVGRLLTGIQRYIRLMWRIRPRIVQGCLHLSNLIVRLSRPFVLPHRVITMAQQGRYTPNRIRTERLTAFLSDRVIANSEGTYNLLTQQAQKPIRNMQVINCGVELDDFIHNAQPSLRETLFPSARFLLVMVARLAPNKDHATLLRALGRLRPHLPEGFQVALVGPATDPATAEQVMRLIHDLGLSDVVTHIPPTRDVAPYYHMADVTILPSVSESFGLVVVEAFAAQKPVIVSTAANVLGLVKDGETGWVFPTGDDAALAAVLEQAWNTPTETLQAMGQRGAEQVPPFNVEVMVKQYLALYDQSRV